MAHVSLAKMYVPSCILPTTRGRIAFGSTAPYKASLVNIAKVNPPLICRKLSFSASSNVGALLRRIKCIITSVSEDEWKMAPCFSRYCLKVCALIKLPL